MRVLQVIPAVAPRYGGPSVAVVQICRALCDRGIDARIATTDADGNSHLPVALGSWETHEGVPAIFFRKQWSESLKYSRPLERWLGERVGDFDLVHIDSVFSHPSLAAARACRKRGIPYVVRPLGHLDPWSLKQNRIRKRIFWSLAARRMVKGAAALHFTTEQERRLAERFTGATPALVTPLGLEDSFIDAVAEGPRSPEVLFLSRLHPKKGIEVLFPAFARAVKGREERHPWRLVVAGDGDPGYVASLRRLAESEGIAGRVEFRGWLSGAGKIAALRSAEVYALPSYQENFGISALEAMAAGVPVVVGEGVNLAPEIENAGAGWVAEVAVEPFRRVLEACLADAGERRKRGTAGRELVMRRFRWSSISEELAAHYRAIAARGTLPAAETADSRSRRSA